MRGTDTSRFVLAAALAILAPGPATTNGEHGMDMPVAVQFRTKVIASTAS
jgi:hypothetical protein